MTTMQVPATKPQEKKVVEMVASRTRGLAGAELAGCRVGRELCLWAPSERPEGFATLLAIKGGGLVLTLHDHGWDGEQPGKKDVECGKKRHCEFGFKDLSLAAMDLAVHLHGLEIND